MELNSFQDEKLELNAKELRQTLNIESGKLSWEELQVHFARGAVVVIHSELDLIDISTKFVNDDKPAIEVWMNTNKIARATDDNAKQWLKNKTDFWAVVVPPWVLVQEIIGDCNHFRVTV